jgi:hypothetical protein
MLGIAVSIFVPQEIPDKINMARTRNVARFAFTIRFSPLEKEPQALRDSKLEKVLVTGNYAGFKTGLQARFS